jgi:hypothetical protein
MDNISPPQQGALRAILSQSAFKSLGAVLIAHFFWTIAGLLAILPRFSEDAFINRFTYAILPTAVLGGVWFIRAYLRIKPPAGPGNVRPFQLLRYFGFERDFRPQTWTSVVLLLALADGLLSQSWVAAIVAAFGLVAVSLSVRDSKPATGQRGGAL